MDGISRKTENPQKDNRKNIKRSNKLYEKVL